MGRPARERAVSSSIWNNLIAMARIIKHSRFCWRLPLKALQLLLNKNAFWARQRSLKDLKKMLRGSEAVVSLWEEGVLVGFGRASSDGIYRAVLWDVVVDEKHQGQGNGTLLLGSLLEHRALTGVERVYLITTNNAGFYKQLGFEEIESQTLMGKGTIKAP